MGAMRMVGAAALLASGWLLAAARPPVATPPAIAAPQPASVKAGVERWRAGDYAAAVAIWQPFATAGDADALFNMGQAYKLGRGVAQDAAAARDYYRKAASKGHLPAQANLGIALFQAGDKPESIRWLRTAADRGEARAQYVLGIAAYNGDGLPRSQALGYGYLLRAQASGLPQAASALGTIAPALSPTDRIAGEAIAASLAAGTGVPTALAAAAGPRLITPPVALSNVIKPVPVTTAVTRPPLGTVPPVVPRSAIAPTQLAAVSAAVPKAIPERAAVQITLAPPPEVRQEGSIAPAAVPARSSTAPSTAIGATASPPAPAVIATVEVAAAKPAPLIVVPPKPIVAPPAPRQPAIAVLKPFETIDKPAAKKPSGWRVQLGAFSQRKLADAAWAAAKPNAGGAKPIFADEGAVIKLQVGPYASRDAAKSACAKLSDAGRACFITNG